MKIVYGILTFIVGFVIMLVLAGVFGQSGSAPLTNSSFNSGIVALSVSILFLCAVLVVCTPVIVNTLKSKQ